MRIFILSILAIMCNMAVAQPISQQFYLKWTAPIGLTTYRTQMQWDAKKGLIWVGSNGVSRTRQQDPRDGMYVLKGKTGGVMNRFVPEDMKDGDVNGVALYKKWAFWGSDDGKVYAFKNRKPVWTYAVPTLAQNSHFQGDIEGQPALGDVNGDGFPDVVVAAENYGLIVLDGKTGTEIWAFAGTRGNGYGLNSPALVDLDGDGLQDVIWGTRTDKIYKAPGAQWGNYGDYVFALNGSDGSVMWQYPLESALHASPLVREENGEVAIYIAETYSSIHRFDVNGNRQFHTAQGMPTLGISAYFSSPAITDENRLIIGTSWWGEEDGIWVMDLNQDFFDAEQEARDLMVGAKTFHQAGRVSATARMGDVYDHPGREAFIGTETGELFVFGAEGKLLYRLALEAGVEAPVMIADVDKDGKDELLVACLDGMLYCYERK